MTREQWFKKGLDIGLSHLLKAEAALKEAAPKLLNMGAAQAMVSRETQALRAHIARATSNRRLLGYRVKWDRAGVAWVGSLQNWDACVKHARYLRRYCKECTKVRIVSVWRVYK